MVRKSSVRKAKANIKKATTGKSSSVSRFSVNTLNRNAKSQGKKATSAAKKVESIRDKNRKKAAKKAAKIERSIRDRKIAEHKLREHQFGPVHKARRKKIRALDRNARSQGRKATIAARKVRAIREGKDVLPRSTRAKKAGLALGQEMMERGINNMIRKGKGRK